MRFALFCVLPARVQRRANDTMVSLSLRRTSMKRTRIFSFRRQQQQQHTTQRGTPHTHTANTRPRRCSVGTTRINNECREAVAPTYMYVHTYMRMYVCRVFRLALPKTGLRPAIHRIPYICRESRSRVHAATAYVAHMHTRGARGSRASGRSAGRKEQGGHDQDVVTRNGR